MSPECTVWGISHIKMSQTICHDFNVSVISGRYQNRSWQTYLTTPNVTIKLHWLSKLCFFRSWNINHCQINLCIKLFFEYLSNIGIWKFNIRKNCHISKKKYIRILLCISVVWYSYQFFFLTLANEKNDKKSL